MCNIIVALNTRNPEMFNFEHRGVKKVFTSLRALLLLCKRKAECATKYLLSNDDPRVTAELRRATEEAAVRTDKGFSHRKTIQVCEDAGIPWVTCPVSNWPDVAAPPWYGTLSARQQHAPCFSLKQQPDAGIVFRNIDRRQLGQGRTAGKGPDGKVVLGTISPLRNMFAFTGDGVPRLVLGRESLALQGFPVMVLDSEAFNRDQPRAKGIKPGFMENHLQDIADNMVATPVMLAIVMATMAVLTWISAPAASSMPLELAISCESNFEETPTTTYFADGTTTTTHKCEVPRPRVWRRLHPPNTNRQRLLYGPGPWDTQFCWICGKDMQQLDLWGRRHDGMHKCVGSHINKKILALKNPHHMHSTTREANT